MKHRLAFLAAVASAMLASAACDPARAPADRPGDAGYFYTPAPLPVPPLDGGAPTDLPPHDGGARPSVELVAGVPGGRGDVDGVGARARVGLVGGMVRVGDALIFADEGNGTLRSFSPATSAVETLARLPVVEGGRPALPAFVAYDGKGKLFVTDRVRQVVYALDLASRALSVVAGKPAVRGGQDGALADATFDAPTGIAFDGDHALFVADTGGRHVRRIDLAAGTVSTLPHPFLQVWGLCFAGDALYATDNLDEAVLRIDPRSSDVAVVAGASRFAYFGTTDGPGKKARFHEPRGIGCGKAALYVADRGNSLLRKIDLATLTVTTVAGQGSGNTGFRDGDAEGAVFEDLQSAVEWDDTVYAGDDATLRALAGGAVRTVLGAPDQAVVMPEDRPRMLRPEGLAVTPDGTAAYVSSCVSNVVERIDLATGEDQHFAGSTSGPGFADGEASNARFHCPGAVASDGQGNLFVADHDNHAVRAIREGTREVLTVAGTVSACGNADGPLESATFCDPSGLAFGKGKLFVADAAAHTLRVVDLSARTVSTLAGAAFQPGQADGPATLARFSAPSGMAFAFDALFVADRENGVVRRVDPATGAVTTLAGVRFLRPRAIGASGEGALLVADAEGVWRVPASGGSRALVVRGGRGLRLGADGPELSLPADVAELRPGEALALDRTENALLRVHYLCCGKFGH